MKPLLRLFVPLALLSCALGAAPLHRDAVFKGKTRNQITVFINRGILRADSGNSANSGEKPDGPEKPDTDTPRLADPYSPEAPLHERVRAYFATNCAHCHIPNGGGNSTMDLTPWAAPDKQHLLDAVPEHGNFGQTDARLISRGNGAPSVLPTRMAMRGTPGQMPPLGTALPDTAAIQLLSEWLQSLPPAPSKP
jgi:mono/diheme cytochrome c family protein